MEIAIGGFALSVILTVVLSVIYSLIPAIPDRAKSAIAIGCGMGLGIVGMIYGGAEITGKVVIDYLLAGFMTGAAAVGLYEFQAKARNVKAKKRAAKQGVKPTKPHIIGVIFLALAILGAGCIVSFKEQRTKDVLIQVSSQTLGYSAAKARPEIIEPGIMWVDQMLALHIGEDGDFNELIAMAFEYVIDDPFLAMNFKALLGLIEIDIDSPTVLTEERLLIAKQVITGLKTGFLAAKKAAGV